MNWQCRLGFHTRGRHWVAAPGGRDVMRCVRCDKVLEERSMMASVNLPPMPRPKGKASDSWMK